MGIRLAVAHWSQDRYDQYRAYYGARPEYGIEVLPGIFKEPDLLNSVELRGAVDAVLIHEEIKGFEDRATVETIRKLIGAPVVVIATSRPDRIPELRQIGADHVVYEYDQFDFDGLANRLINLVGRAGPAAAAPPPLVEAITHPGMAPGVAPSFDVTRDEPVYQTVQTRGTFVVMGVAGGVGATTVAYHLARVLAENTVQVCLLDARYPRSTLLDLLPIEGRETFLGRLRGATLYQLARARQARGDRRFNLNELLRVALHGSKKTGFTIIPSGISDTQAAELAGDPQYERVVEDLCRTLERSFATYNITLVGPDPLVSLHTEALKCAARVILVTTQYPPYYARMLQLIEALQEPPFGLAPQNIDLIVNRFTEQSPLRRPEFELKRTGIRKLGEISDHRIDLERRAQASLQGHDLTDADRAFEEEIVNILRYFESGAGVEIAAGPSGKGGGLWPFGGKR